MTYNPTKHNRRSIRLKGYDYSQAGLYFITICTHLRTCLFGRIENGIMVLNQFGDIAVSEWNKTTEIRKNVELGEFIVMPNHVHVIIRLLGRGELNSPQNKSDVCNTQSDVCNTQSDVCNTQSDVCNTSLRSPSQTIGAIVRGYKSSVTKQLGLLGLNETIWQRNYHEHIIRDEFSYTKIEEYIKNNPANWNNDSLK